MDNFLGRFLELIFQNYVIMACRCDFKVSDFLLKVIIVASGSLKKITEGIYRITAVVILHIM
jgi:hypothetical protein